MREFARQVYAVLAKDITAELRTKDIMSSVLVFAILVLVIFSFAFQPTAQTVALIAPGVLWVTFSFAGVLGLNRSFILEKDQGCLQGLMLCPVDRASIYAGKMLGSLIFMLAVEAATLPVFAILFNLPLFMPEIILVTVLATIGFAAVGTIFSAMAVNTRAREIMLPILFFPIIVPVIIAAVKFSGGILMQESLGSLGHWLQLIIAFDVIFLAVTAITFEYVLEE